MMLEQFIGEEVRVTRRGVGGRDIYGVLQKSNGMYLLVAYKRVLTFADSAIKRWWWDRVSGLVHIQF